jgi:CrcB protein
MLLVGLVMLGGSAGAVTRYVIGRALNGRHPWGTLAVNVVGAGLLGALVGVGPQLSHAMFALLGTGLCGALTTWSTLATELVALPRRAAIAYGLVTISGGLTTTWLGWYASATLTN